MKRFLFLIACAIGSVLFHYSQCQVPSGYSEALSEAAMGLTGRAPTHLLPVPQAYLCNDGWWHACPSGTCTCMMLSCICCHAV